MAFVTVRELKRLVHVHYLLNILLALSFLILKKTPQLCSKAFREGCEFTSRQNEILFFCAVIIVFRTRKHGAVQLLPYLKTACLLAKLTNFILFFMTEPVIGVIYSIVCVLHFLLLPEPCFQGKGQITFFRARDLDAELKSTKKTWLIELYTSWNPKCVEFAPVFTELSATYALDNLCFGKVDLSRNPETAEKFHINTTPISKQLPTIILFEKGKESMRRPVVQNNGKLANFSFTFESMVNEFDLNNLYATAKASTPKVQIKEKSKDD